MALDQAVIDVTLLNEIRRWKEGVARSAGGVISLYLVPLRNC